jgi:GNAT superfamily N-acetyltransferase
MNSEVQSLEWILEQDPTWSAYALADLEPEHQHLSTWHCAGQSVLLIYRGLDPPVLFMQGDLVELGDLLAEVPPGRYQFSSLPEHLELMQHDFSVERTVEMRRMRFSGEVNPLIDKKSRAVRLDESHLDSIRALIRDQPDAPDAFLPAQLKSGIFFGIFDRRRMVALSGTHVRSPSYKVAAIGNVFTDPDYRGQGFASLTTGAVVHDLIMEGTQTIVLNVVHSNKPAVVAYERIGFRTHCSYFEGYASKIKR